MTCGEDIQSFLTLKFRSASAVIHSKLQHDGDGQKSFRYLSANLQCGVHAVA